MALAPAEVELELPRPHDGQWRVLNSPARFKAVRSGRRWGKTTVGEIEATDTLCGGGIITPYTGRPLPVGWFAPTYKIFLDAWDRLVALWGPLIVEKNATEKRIRLVTGGLFEGWSLDTDDPARSRRYGKVIIDEAGMVPHLKSVWLQAIRPTLVDFQGRALFLGTPKVLGPDFNDLFDLGDPESPTYDPQWESFRGKTIENIYLPGVREEVEKARREMPEWMFGQEYEGEPAEGDAAFFSRRVVKAHEKEHARPPLLRGSIEVDAELAADRDRILRSAGRLDHINWVPDPDKGPWRLWCRLVPDAQGRMRPDQSRAYAAGMDLGYGVGSSNTAVKVYDADTLETVAEFAHPGVTPAEMAHLWAAAGYWFGGLQGCCPICPEANGPGEEFITALIAIGYPGIYRERKGAATVSETVTAKYGWTSTRQAKEALLGDYRKAMASGRLIERSADTLRECLKFRYDELGRVVCDEEDVEADGPARAPHGDRVIASALAVLCSRFTPRVRAEKREAPVGSLAWMRKQADARRDQRKRW